VHPAGQQDALRSLLADIGYAGALLVRELANGTLMLIDGHLRAETTPDAVVPVLVLDVDEAEADKILLTHDPLAGMATVDDAKLKSLLATVEIRNGAVREMIDEVARNQAGRRADVELIPPLPRPEATIRESFQVIVECRDEEDQQGVYERMRAEGYRCRVLTL
jgi:hypothetical protein